MKRSRGRGRRPQNAGNRSYDSNGPDVRVRGTAFQLHEKYMTLARDAMSSGDRVVAENYQQHAEHYFRILQTMSPNLPTNAASGGSTAENGDVGVPPASDTSASDKPNGTDKNNTGVENTAKATPSDGDVPNANGVAAQSEKPTQKSRRRGPLATDDTSSDTDSDSDTSETASK